MRLILSVLLLTAMLTPAYGQVPAAEREALIAFYHATGGDNWRYNKGWMGDPGTECSWAGVKCTNRSVSQLSLESIELTGSIPPSIGLLSNLTRLSLRHNQLTGLIPTEIGSLSKLTWFAVDGNKLTGSIPLGITSLSKLQTLYLHRNQLTGSIPSGIGSLSNLAILTLHENQLTGHIPPEIGSLLKLYWLDLSGNKLTGTIPPEIGSLSKLENLNLSNNKLTGLIPAEIGSLSILFLLILNDNQLTGPIPSELLKLSKLDSLMLQNNFLTGSVPKGLSDLPLLTLLDLSNNPRLNTEAPNVPPVVRIVGGNRVIADTNNIQGETVTLIATASDSDGTIASTQWLVAGQVVATGTSATLALADGATTVTFRATDNSGATTTTSAVITVGSVVAKPAEYLGTYNGIAIDPRYNLEVNQVGLIIIDRSRLYSCVRIFENSQPAQVAGMNKIDVTFNILSLDTGAIQIVATRPFSDQSSTDAQPTECSGRFETTTGVYRDYIKLGAQLFNASFRLVNGNTLEFLLVDAQEVLIKN